MYKSAPMDVKGRSRAEIWWILVTWPEAGFGWRRITSANRNLIRIFLELGSRYGNSVAHLKRPEVSARTTRFPLI